MKKEAWKKLLVSSALTVGILTLAACGKQAEEQTDSAVSTESATATESSDSASESTESATQNVFAMDTYMTLTAYGDKADEAVEAAVEEIDRIEKLVSTGIDSSEIAQINANGEGDVSEDTAYLIKRSKEIYDSTGGVFDITIYPIMEAWGFTTQEYRVPEQTELDDLRKLMGADKVALNKEENHVTLETEGMEIDLGGIAKGYTSGRVMDIFRSYGIKHAVISLGGNVQLLGDKIDGSLWRVAVEDPQDTSNYIGVLETKDVAVITSGGYERYFEQDGKTYHHIIDPSTGYPAESGLTSVTIVSEDSTLADGLSTSLFIMGPDQAAQYWKEHSDEFDVIMVRDDESVIVSEGIADSFSTDESMTVIKKDN